MCLYNYIHTCNQSLLVNREAMNLKENGDRFQGEFRGRGENEEMTQFYYNIKKCQ